MVADELIRCLMISKNNTIVCCFVVMLSVILTKIPNLPETMTKNGNDNVVIYLLVYIYHRHVQMVTTRGGQMIVLNYIKLEATKALET
jgi:hypothetical protein